MHRMLRVRCFPVNESMALQALIFKYDSTTMEHKGFIVAGTHSGCGKTTITMGLISALRARGLVVQPYKSGPDYIDPGFHSAAAERSCRNLDTRMLNEITVRELYRRHIQNADIAIVEGVMGLFDGAGADDERGSAAHLSKILGLPVILVIDARAMARSAAAMAYGYARFDSDIRVAGFIMNRVGSDKHAALLKTAVEAGTGLPVLGCLKREGDWVLPDRHLGLIPSWENKELQDKIRVIGTGISEGIDIDAVREVAATAKPLADEENLIFPMPPPSITDDAPVIAVARDAAFCFYYEDNLDLLRNSGASLKFFSPLSDEGLPAGTSAVWLGGGYPELHGERLSANKQFLAALRDAAGLGMPIFGECGGYMYLSQAIVDKEGRRHPMAQLLPGTAVMGRKLAALGYCSALSNQKTFLGPPGTALNGHVFHWSEMTDMPEESGRLFTVIRDSTELGAGDSLDSVVGSWLHIHFASNPLAAARFVEAARLWKENRS